MRSNHHPFACASALGELLFATVVELMVSPGLQPSLHAAALDVAPLVIEAQLAHAVKDTNERTAECVEAAQRIVQLAHAVKDTNERALIVWVIGPILTSSRIFVDHIGRVKPRGVYSISDGCNFLVACREKERV